jgi:hypothetical protein
MRCTVTEPHNEQAFDVLRAEIADDLHDLLPRQDGIDWRAARGGNNQVGASYRMGGVAANDPDSDASWLTAVPGHGCSRWWHIRFPICTTA